jgi:hypothetical protein
LLVAACQGELVTSTPDAGPGISEGGSAGSSGGGGAGGHVGTIVGSFPGDVTSVAMDDTYLYAALFQAIYRLRRDGAGGAQLLANTSSFNDGVVVDDTNVYWTDLCGPDPDCGQGEVQSIPKAGGTVTTLASAQQRPWSMVADETHLYWTNQGQDYYGQPFGGGQVVSIPKAGGTPLVLVNNLELTDSLALDNAGGIVFHANNIVGRVPKSGGAQTTLENLLDGCPVSNFVVSGTKLYYSMGLSASNTGPLVAVPTNANDTAAPTVGPSGVLAPSVNASALATVGTTLLWASGGGKNTVGEIWAMNLADGSTSIFAQSDAAETASGSISVLSAGLVADAKGVYSLEYRGAYSGAQETIVRAFSPP